MTEQHEHTNKYIKPYLIRSDSRITIQRQLLKGKCIKHSWRGKIKQEEPVNEHTHAKYNTQNM